MMHQSIATIDSPEFINLQPLEINPLMSSCEIKVLYLGENRNHSFITKEVATEMAKTLRGAPIVGYYKEEKEDFVDHGEKIIFDDEGVKFECMTKPYGFVSPDAKVWFQKFTDTDEFGNEVEREYLMTTGYLWTGQFEECELPIKEGRPQSMELDPETVDGHWSTNSKTGMDFFIINDAIFSKLCILGEDVEPCFEGASVTAPDISTSFTKMDDNFKHTLYTMMQDLKFALEGGKNMELDEKEKVVDVNEETSTLEEEVKNEEVLTENDKSDESDLTENEENIEANQSSEETVEEGSQEEELDNSNEEETLEEENNDNASEEEEESINYEDEYNRISEEYALLKEQYNELLTFKETVENEKKDALIESFYMLSQEDKEDVIKNKSKYSLEDIEAKLSVICVRKKVNFDLEDNNKNEEKVEEKKDSFTYNLNEEDLASTPAWIAAVKRTRDDNKN